MIKSNLIFALIAFALSTVTFAGKFSMEQSGGKVIIKEYNKVIKEADPNHPRYGTLNKEHIKTIESLLTEIKEQEGLIAQYGDTPYLVEMAKDSIALFEGGLSETIKLLK